MILIILNTTCGPCGTINVIYTITDDCGNATATLSATLTFDDGTIPDLIKLFRN